MELKNMNIINLGNNTSTQQMNQKFKKINTVWSSILIFLSSHDNTTETRTSKTDIKP